jgi:5'-3' exoribonuclease 2
MGVPNFFLKIIQNKYYKNVHSGVKNGKLNSDYFFLDYNGIVYKAYDRIKKTIEGSNLNKNQIEDIIIEEVIRYTKYLICEVVKPNILTYIALDGPAPRAKMVQQRSRRYKGYHEKILMKKEKLRLKLVEDESNEWDRSANISPGTEFMHKLSEALVKMIKVKGFSVHNDNMKVVLSDGNIPGEGEHKFMPVIKDMISKKSYENMKVYIYGSDADLIILSMASHKNNIHIIREVQETRDLMKNYESYEFLELNIDNLSNAFNHDLTRVFKDHTFDRLRILNDYVFLTFLVGNDFVISMPFLKVRKGGLELLIAIYHDIKLHHNDYLIINNQINILFFKELIFEISKKEDFEMKQQYKEINKLLNGYKEPRRIEYESKMTPFQIYSSRYSHLQVCSSDHPLFEEYHNEFKKINYEKEYDIWKDEYYRYYLNVDTNDKEEYLKVRTEIVTNYLESLMFNLNYYFYDVPSWRWHYEYRISPLISDIHYVLENNIVDMNKITFEKGEPYKPFEQLMLILPPQMCDLVPSVLRPIMTDDKLLCTQFYPIDFKLDISTGIKTIYSEAILPEINEELLISTVQKYDEKLSVEEKKRNTISLKPKIG